MSRRLGMRKDAPRLLGTVDGRPHASSDDHDGALVALPKPLNNNISATGTRITKRYYPGQGSNPSPTRDYPTPPCSNQSNTSRIGREPEPGLEDDPLSSDEDVSTLPGVKQERSPATKSRRPDGLQCDGAKDQRLGSGSDTGFRRPGLVKPEQKRKAEDLPSSDDQIFGSQSKRLKTSQSTASAGFVNVHAQPRAKAAYGKAAKKKQEFVQKKQQQESEAREVERRKKEDDQKNTFQRPKISGRRLTSPDFRSLKLRQPTTAPNFSSPLLDSPLSDHRSYNVNESACLQDLDSVQIACAICGEQIPREWKAEFDDTVNKKRYLNYKWQQRFCRYHRERNAQDVWEERGYPSIDWIALPVRLKSRKHLTRLKKILSGEIQSTFRDRLQSDQKQGSLTLMNVVKDGKSASKTSNAGYYGPRGERLMTSLILTHLAGDVRAYETSSTIFSGSGIFGGVAGFVQAVLVPELALSLIAEDLEAGGIRREPLEVLEESASLGELVCPEEEDNVVRDESGSVDGLE